MLTVSDLGKTYGAGENSLTVLDNISFEVEPGESVAIIGPSGSGKTTLLGLCAGLDKSSSGKIILNGEELSRLDEDQRAEVRNKYVGFIFQNFRLLPTLTALENVAVPLELRGDKSAAKRAKELLERVGLGDRTHHYPSQLSGGEQQRVALARAFSNNPLILFADEPTGNLDPQTSVEVMKVLQEINDSGRTIIMATHDYALILKYPHKTLKCEGSKIFEVIQKAI